MRRFTRRFMRGYMRGYMRGSRIVSRIMWNRNGHPNFNHCDLGNLGVDLDRHGILEKGRNGLRRMEAPDSGRILQIHREELCAVW